MANVVYEYESWILNIFINFHHIRSQGYEWNVICMIWWYTLPTK
jgi:hypothetical protein